MKQYLQIKAAYPEHILLFRLGDFYEMFFDDAVRYALFGRPPYRLRRHVRLNLLRVMARCTGVWPSLPAPRRRWILS